MVPIHNITFSYHAAEDRIILSCTLVDQEKATLLLTRRMAGPILERLAQLLVDSSKSVATLPSEMREEVMMVEHARALARVAEQVSTSEPVPELAGETLLRVNGNLITRVDIHPDGERCSLLFFCDGNDSVLTGLTLNRAQLHWFADATDRFAQRGGWVLQAAQRNWLAKKDADAAGAPQAAMLH
ncbi:MAG: hypothetical protein KGZ83_12170 [Sulfuricella sp.]|nr:hypothetical protein [Sulfuricella sp.]